MTEIPDALRALFETPVEADGDHYVLPIPTAVVENGSLSADETYRIAVLPSDAEGASREGDSGPSPAFEADRGQPASSDRKTETGHQADHGAGSSDEYDSRTPPVTEGEERTVSIDALGDQGDGIARVERGFILIVPGTKPGDTVEVQITDVKDSVAFADPIGEATVR